MVIVGSLVAVVTVLGGVAVSLALRATPSLTPIEECEKRVAAWSAGNRIWQEAGAPPVRCVPGPRPGHSGLWDGHTIKIWPAGAAFWRLPLDTFYDGILWHELGHAYASNAARLDSRRAEYDTIRGIPGISAADSNEDYAAVFAYSQGHVWRWYSCDAGYCWASRPTAGQIETLRGLDLLPAEAHEP